jgi:hypothetical protein
MGPTNTLDGQNTGGAPPADSGLLDNAKELWRELRALAHDQLTLAALETKLAGKSLVNMIAAGVMVAILLISAWLGLMGAAVLWLVNIGVMASVAMLIAVAANLALAAILYELIRRQSRRLQFPATLRSLRPLPSSLEIEERP